MRAIVKCVLPTVAGPFTCLLQNDADLIHCGTENVDVALWFIADKGTEPVEHSFFLAVAGMDLPAWCTAETHIASVHARWMERGWFLLHIFGNGVRAVETAARRD